MEEVAAPPPPRGDKAGGTEMHPLENLVVLKRLFQLIPFQLNDFQRIRLVSRAWKDESLSTWRKNAWLTLHDSGEDESDNENVKDEDEIEIAGISRQKYLDLLDNEQLKLVELPFRKYSLRNWKIELQTVNQDGEQDQIRFWNRVGPLIKHMKVSDSNFAGVADFRTVIFEATSNLQSLKLSRNVYIDKRPATKVQRLDPKLSQHAMIPAEQVQNNLVKLGIDLDNPPDDEDQKFLPITWMELIIHFPNIKIIGPLELGETTEATEAELLELFESVEILRKERGPGYLAHLIDLDLRSIIDGFSIGGTLISSINRLQFSLKRLEVAVDSTVDEETIKQLLQHPLEYLTVIREHDEDAMPFQNFPFGLKFMALKDLDMWGPIAPNLVFLRECPKLEEFTYNPGNDREADLTLGLNDGNLTKLEKLKYLRIKNCLASAEQIWKLGELMPNMEDLGIGLDDGGFRAVCEVWKQLEELHVGPWRIGEEEFLGIDEHSGEKYHHPNITDLKNLKQFRGHQQEFTDAMILDGLLALPNLKTMYRISVSSQVTPYARSQLQLKFPKCEIFTQDEEPADGNEFAVAVAEFQQN